MLYIFLEEKGAENEMGKFGRFMKKQTHHHFHIFFSLKVKIPFEIQ